MSLHEDRALLVANQLELWAAPSAAPIDGLRVIRRDGRESAFDPTVLAKSILRAGWPGESLDSDTVTSLSQAVHLYLQHSNQQPVTVATLRETVERLLIDMGYTLTARMYAGAFAPSPAADANTGMFDEPLPIDRAERLLAAAAADAGLDRHIAEEVVAAILRQISASGVEQLLPGLLREWMRSELRTRGLALAASRLARISMPVSALHDAFAESGDAPIISPADPEAAALALAGRVSAAYVLGQLMPSAVGQAHVRGDIQVRGIGNFLRFDSVTMDLEGLKEHGPLSPGVAKASAADPRTLVARLCAQSDTLARFFGGDISWSAVNFGIAPCLAACSDDEVKRIAHELIARVFIQRRKSTLRSATPEIRLTWDAPDDGPAELVAPGGTRVLLADCYADARRFFDAALSSVLRMTEEGAALPPRITLNLSPYFFGAPEANYHLECIGRVAASGAPLALRYASAAPLMFDDAGQRRPAEIVAQTVVLSAARAATLSTGLDPFLARLDATLDIAVAAHLAKHEFLKGVMDRRGGPLALLQRSVGGIPFADASSMRYRIAVSGLGRAALARAAAPWIAPGDELAIAEAALNRLRQSCARWMLGTGRHFTLSGADTARAGERSRLRLAESVAFEGQLHPLYDVAPHFAVSGEAFADPADIAEFIRHAFLHTSCRALQFS